MSKKKDDETAPSPWLNGVRGVKGVVPPGRRLANEKRPNKWSASGVQGVTPPGNVPPGGGPGADWAEKTKKEREKRAKDNQRAVDKAKRTTAQPSVPDNFDRMRPMEGFVPDVFADMNDPDDMKSFLKRISDFVSKLAPAPDCAENLASLITQSSAPYEVVVGFTILSAVIGKNPAMRRRYGLPLERGAKVFFNLAQRLKNDVKIPRGLIPETVDAMFYDLPSSAYEVPYAFGTSAFISMMELLRTSEEDDEDRVIGAFAVEIYDRFVAKRSLGDQSLSGMFPLDLPEWVPDDVD